MDRHCIRISHLELGKKFATLGPAVRTAGFRDAQFLGCKSNRLVNHSQHLADLSVSLLSTTHENKGPGREVFRYKEKEVTPPDRGNGFVNNYPTSSVEIVRHGRKLPIYEQETPAVIRLLFSLLLRLILPKPPNQD
jgi:hypothetical protein